MIHSRRDINSAGGPKQYHGTELSDEEGDEEHTGTNGSAWSNHPGQCAACLARNSRRHKINRVSAQDNTSSNFPTAPLRIVSAASKNLLLNRIVGRIWGARDCGHRPFQGGGWCPRPAMDSSGHNLAAELPTCEQCGQHCLTFRTTRHVDSGEVLRLARDTIQNILDNDPSPPIEITFDGATRRVGNQVVGGAAAVAQWTTSAPNLQDRRILCRLAVELPQPATQIQAEARGARLACLILQDIHQNSDDTQPCRVGGGNPPVVRYCRGTGHLMCPRALLA